MVRLSRDIRQLPDSDALQASASSVAVKLKERSHEGAGWKQTLWAVAFQRVNRQRFTLSNVSVRRGKKTKHQKCPPVSFVPITQLNLWQHHCLHYLHFVKLNPELLQCINSENNPAFASINDAFVLLESAASDATHFHRNLSMQRTYLSPWVTPPQKTHLKLLLISSSPHWLFTHKTILEDESPTHL